MEVTEMKGYFNKETMNRLQNDVMRDVEKCLTDIDNLILETAQKYEEKSDDFNFGKEVAYNYAKHMIKCLRIKIETIFEVISELEIVK